MASWRPRQCQGMRWSFEPGQIFTGLKSQKIIDPGCARIHPRIPALLIVCSTWNSLYSGDKLTQIFANLRWNFSLASSQSPPINWLQTTSFNIRVNKRNTFKARSGLGVGVSRCRDFNPVDYISGNFPFLHMTFLFKGLNTSFCNSEPGTKKCKKGWGNYVLYRSINGRFLPSPKFLRSLHLQSFTLVLMKVDSTAFYGILCPFHTYSGLASDSSIWSHWVSSNSIQSAEYRAPRTIPTSKTQG